VLPSGQFENRPPMRAFAAPQVLDFFSFQTATAVGRLQVKSLEWRANLIWL
jgi:hypothetical protein